MSIGPQQTRKTILVVDDDPHILEVLEVRLVSAGYDVVAANNGLEALEVLSRQPVRLVISDMRMPGMDGMRMLEEMERRGIKLPIIFLTAHGSIPGAVEAIKHGAVDYLTKPFDGQELLARVTDVFAKAAGLDAAKTIKAGDGGQLGETGLVGQSQAMRDLAALIERVAPRDVNVLILGESGTGKELVANLIHRRSSRKNGPIVTVDCGSTPAGLLESELFGHVKGSFTHAVKDKKGLIEQANLGTLFLDEIGNISTEMQVRLLRFLENHKIRRIGDVREIQVDCRVIAATNADIFEQVAEGVFREDLLYRLKVVTINVPPLRERREDIPILAEHFARQFCAAQGMPPVTIPTETMAYLTAYPWPGNVRQLRNALEAGVVLGSDGQLVPQDLQLPLAGKGPDRSPDNLSLDQSEKAAIVRALEQAGWVQKEAAPLLGVSRRALNYKIQKYGIEIPKRRVKK
ncbi:MAG: response regulator (CheY-like receiver, AAA-type ATPase and DNA-binding domain containing protein) [Solidesulfovibrio magneticus str. Maddingley MBC34]|uniref:Response regulator (CheY-like receiver, AAA-type ATPase and DNA-binding domain containing protein) n=1 Tax=Solidesulfovibrio magneticus str. Maddingley MBC34 TaxID=1206767 RepID=K6GVZ0_9BACT|nr:MAG: response regulator (CheY-like receiver, AAA-type ATPase and DNA-binding domain containing protein) [Solidesulfovibrio magneticus str. Maddingley MBC34]